MIPPTAVIEEAEHLQFVIAALNALIGVPDVAKWKTRFRRLVEIEDAVYGPDVRATERGSRRFVIEGMGAAASARNSVRCLPSRRCYLSESYLRIDLAEWPASLREQVC